PVAPSVHLLQLEETFRALRLLEATRFGVNRSVFQLSPLNDDIYLFELNPLPDDIQSVLAEPLNQMMSIYETGEGWIPDPRPNPMNAQNPFDALDEMIPTLARAYV